MKFIIAVLLPIYMFALNIDFDTFSADFTQTVTNSHNKKIVYIGSISVKKPDKALWSYKKPVNKELFINKNQVVVYEPELFQAIYMHKKSLPNISEILKNAVGAGGGKYRAKSGEKDIFFTLNGTLPASIHYKDEMDNAVEIVFANQKKNPNISNELFEFKAPNGIDIIQQ